MKHSKTTLKELSKRYKAVLLKCLMLNMGIMLCASAAVAEQEVIDSTFNNNYEYMSEGFHSLTSDDISASDLKITGTEVYTQYDYEITDGQKITLENATLNINGSGEPALIISGGEVVSTFLSEDLDEDGGLHGNGIIMTGGSVDLTNSGFISEDGNDFIMTGGAIALTSENDGSSVLGVEADKIEDGDIETITTGTVKLTNGTITVNGGDTTANQYENSNFLMGSDITLGDASGSENEATLTINKNAALKVISEAITNEATNEITFTKGAIQLNDTGIINLSGALVSDVNGTGTINMADSNAYIDGDVSGINLNISTGVSLSMDSFSSLSEIASLSVNQNAQFGLTDNLTSIVTTVSGTLDLATNTLSTNYFAVEDNATVAFLVSGLADGMYGTVNASDFDISETGTNLILTLDTGVLAKDETATFTIFSDTDGDAIDINFANLSENARYEFVSNGDGTYDITGTASAGDVVQDAGGNTGNVAAADAWDEGVLDSASDTAKEVAAILNTLSQTSTADYIDALTALAPEATGSTASSVIDGARQVFNAVSTRFDGSVSNAGRNGGDLAIGEAAIWMQGLLNSSKLSGASGFDSDSYGFAVGVEKNMSDSFKMGVGYAYSNADITATNRATDIATNTALVYGQYKPADYYANITATYSFGKYDEYKNVSGVGVKADYNTDSLAIQALAGYDFATPYGTLTPEGGVRFTHIDQESYTDSADQTVDAKSDNVLTGVIGMKYAKAFHMDNVSIIPEVKYAMTYDFTKADTASITTLANGAVYTTSASPLERFGQEVGVNITADIANQLELSLGYEGKFKQDYQDHTGMLNAKYKF